MEVVGLKLLLGSFCWIYFFSGVLVDVEVVGFVGEKFYLMFFDDMYGFFLGFKVVVFEMFSLLFYIDGLMLFCCCVIDWVKQVLVGEGFFGCVFDGVGCLFDNKGLVVVSILWLLQSCLVNLMIWVVIDQLLDVGICVINVLLMVGCGQCMGFFVGFGVGKLVFFGMMVCYIEVEVIVVGLIGECG